MSLVFAATIVTFTSTLYVLALNLSRDLEALRLYRAAPSVPGRRTNPSTAMFTVYLLDDALTRNFSAAAPVNLSVWVHRQRRCSSDKLLHMQQNDMLL